MGNNYQNALREMEDKAQAGTESPSEPANKSCKEGSAQSVLMFETHDPPKKGHAFSMNLPKLPITKEKEDPPPAKKAHNCEERKLIHMPQSVYEISNETFGKCETAYFGNGLKVTPELFRCEKQGSISDRYETLNFVDRGAFGEVNKVMDRITKQLRAVKVINKEKCQMTHNFADEIKILKRIVRNSRYII